MKETQQEKVTEIKQYAMYNSMILFMLTVIYD